MRSVSRVLILFGLSVCSLLPARAYADDRNDRNDRQVMIFNATATATTLTINGENFGNLAPIVRLNGAELVVQQRTATQVKAVMPLPALTQGTYLLAVIRARRAGDRDEDDATRFGVFNLAIGGGGGATGPQGPSGPAGPAGANGPAGATGAAGATGPAGAIGPQGPAGAAGATGPQGPAGAAGATGPQGATGPAGADGVAGAAGAAGAQGSTGPAGPAGAIGPQGPAGPAGATGATGATGAAGADGATGANGATGPAGANGADGAPGQNGHDGEGFRFAGEWTGMTLYVTNDVVTFQGSSYIAVLATYSMPGTDTSWAVMAAAGAPGTNGAPGAAGATGATGAQGPQGVQGVQGSPGPAGTTGQDAIMMASTGPAVSAATFQGIPGTFTNFNVPANGKIFVAADGGIVTTSSFADGYSIVDIALFVDNVQFFTRRVVAANSTGLVGMIQNWSFSLVLNLAPGAHNVQVATRLVSGSVATVGGASGSVLRTDLSVLTLNH